MGAIKDIAPPAASLLPGIFSGISRVSTPSARNLTPKEFAGHLSEQLGRSICERTVQNWCERGAIDAIRVGGRWLVPATELERFGSAREVPT